MASLGPLPPPRISTSPPSPPADNPPLRSPSFPLLSQTVSSPACDRPGTTRVYRSMIDVAKAAPKKHGNKENPSPAVTRVSSRHDAVQNMIDCDSSAPDGARLTRPATSPDLLKSEPPQSPPPRSETDLAGRENQNTRRSPQPQTLKPPDAMNERRTPAQKEQPPKGTLMKRMSSFLAKKNKILSTSPPKDQPLSSSPSKMDSKHAIPAFSISSSNTSVSASPPSPRSRESTFLIVDEEHLDEVYDEGPSGHGHSSSTSDMRDHNTAPRPGLTWGPDHNEEGSPMEMRPRPRRRSISQDHLTFLRRPAAKEDGSTPVQLMATFSFMSAEGVGAKSRRLSTSLPDEFIVDHCELDKEFRSSSHVPGRRGATIGKGATATVKLMFKKNDMSHTYYAVKEFRKKERVEDELEYVKKVKSEFSIASSLHHPNIVRTVRLCTHAHRWNHVMEYCQYGELFHWVEKGLFKSQFKLSDRLCFFKQLMRGVDYLHSHGIAHRDIKLENILLSAEGYLKITDFGVSEVFSGDHPGLSRAGGRVGQNMGPARKCAPGICGSLPYIAPEVLAKDSEYDPRPLDVWSCAIVYLTMTLQGSPWSAARPADVAYKRYASSWDAWLAKHPELEGRIHDGPGGAPQPGPIFSPECLGSPAVKRLVLKMLDPDPARRITMHDALNSSYVRGIECCAPERCEDDSDDEATGGSQDGCGDGSSDGHAGATVTGQDARADCCGKGFAKKVLRRHSHVPPKEHRTPGFLVHRFDMGDGYR